jgi:hypothetical protein
MIFSLSRLKNVSVSAFQLDNIDDSGFQNVKYGTRYPALACQSYTMSNHRTTKTLTPLAKVFIENISPTFTEQESVKQDAQATSKRSGQTGGEYS